MVVNNKLLALVCALFISGTLIAQELRRMEYFFDADPGYGAGVPIDGIKEGQNTCQIDFSSLEAGVFLTSVPRIARLTGLLFGVGQYMYITCMAFREWSIS